MLGAKNILLFFFLLLSGFTFSQKQLLAITNISFDELGTKIGSDSTAYTYDSPTQAELFELKTTFKLTSTDLTSYLLNENYNQSFNASSVAKYNTYPDTIQIIDSIINLLSNNLIEVTKDIFDTIQHIYEYNLDGKMTLSLKQISTNNQWYTQDSVVFKYDSLANVIVNERYFIDQNTVIGTFIDSTFYMDSTNKITSSIQYQTIFPNTLNITDILKTELTYIGNKIDYIDEFEDHPNGSFLLKYRTEFTHNGANISGYTKYLSLNGTTTLVSNVSAKIFTFNNQNLLTTIYTLQHGSILSKNNFSYDNDNFILESTIHYTDDNDDLYKAWETRYHYSWTTDLKESNNLNILIFPNPAENKLNLKSLAPVKNIQITNMKGQIVLKQSCGNEISIEHLAPAQYIISGQSEQGKFVEQFIKQ